ncbi:hypothetical protein [Aliishimia ponticola]|uniref:hypothetical protein n=1 Tax=Aliishimia ponticola TaxID=2499833 RepID=UPI001FE80A2B|nr:hypothetical protein [Aliishimia ponticola]
MLHLATATGLEMTAWRRDAIRRGRYDPNVRDPVPVALAGNDLTGQRSWDEHWSLGNAIALPAQRFDFVILHRRPIILPLRPE